MTFGRFTLRDTTRRAVTLMALIGLLVRVLAPLPAGAHVHSQDAAALKRLGATLCHVDTPVPMPADPGEHDHCPLCAAASDPPMPHPGQTGIAAPFSFHKGATVFHLTTTKAARAPPEWAHSPRAPPSV